MSLALRVLVLAVATVGLAAVVGGCAIFGESFDPQGREAVDARAAARSAVEGLLDDLVAGRAEHGRVRVDACHEGQDNWKRTDEHAWECRLGAAALVDGAATADDVAATLTGLHERLLDLGCQPSEGGGLLGVVRDYWEPLRDRAGYGPEDLPLQDYTVGGVQIEVVSTAPGAEHLAEVVADPFGSGFGGEVVLSREALTPAAMTAARSSSAAQLLVVRVTTPYYAIRS